MHIPRGDNALARAILSGVAHLPNQQHPLISFKDGTHYLLRYAVARCYLRLQPGLRQFLAQQQVGVMLGTYYDAASLYGPQSVLSPDRRDNQRKHRNQSPGLYDKHARIAYIFQYMLHREVMPVIGQQPDAAGIAAGVWRINGTRDVARIMRHEIWHAIDYNAGLPSRGREFRQAYAADLVGMGGSAAARVAGWGYFIQDDMPNRGPSEVFAECGAALNGGGVRGRTILQRFPESAACVRRFQAALLADMGGAQTVAKPQPQLQRNDQAYALYPRRDATGKLQFANNDIHFPDVLLGNRA